MNRIFAVVLLSLALAGLAVGNIGGPNEGNAPVAWKEYPTVNLPYRLRQHNWLGNKNEGSCVHATVISLLNWGHLYAKAAHWRATYGNGEWPEDLYGKFEREGVRYAETTDGDVSFLQWACETHRGCGVTVMAGKHMVALVHFDDEWAGLLDDNYPEEIIWVPRDEFVAEWKNSFGWAVAIVGTPSNPLPH